MRANTQKRQEEQKLRDLLSSDNKNGEKTLEERIERVKYLQYEEHQQLFAVSYTTIHKAAAENSLAGVKYFLHHGAGGGGGGRGGGKSEKAKKKKLTILEELNKNGMSPLHYAAEKGSIDVINFLLEQECDINFPSFEGNTALMYACKNNQLKAIEALLSYEHCNLLMKNCCGMNCFHFASQCDNYQAIEKTVQQWLEGNTDSASTITKLSTNEGTKGTKHTKKFKQEQEKEVSIQPPQVQQLQPSPSIAEDEEIMNKEQMLLSAINQASNNGTTPLHVAAANGSMKSVELLVKYHGDVNYQDNFGDTPLHKAAKNSYYQIFKLLMVNGASDTIQNTFRETAADCLVDAPSY